MLEVRLFVYKSTYHMLAYKQSIYLRPGKDKKTRSISISKVQLTTKSIGGSTAILQKKLVANGSISFNLTKKIAFFAKTVALIVFVGPFQRQAAIHVFGKKMSFWDIPSVDFWLLGVFFAKSRRFFYVFSGPDLRRDVNTCFGWG